MRELPDAELNELWHTFERAGVGRLPREHRTVAREFLMAGGAWNLNVERDADAAAEHLSTLKRLKVPAVRDYENLRAKGLLEAAAVDLSSLLQARERGDDTVGDTEPAAVGAVVATVPTTASSSAVAAAVETYLPVPAVTHAGNVASPVHDVVASLLDNLFMAGALQEVASDGVALEPECREVSRQEQPRAGAKSRKVSGQFLEVSIDAIDVPTSRMRAAHVVAALADSIRENGLLHQPVVTSDLVLVSGAHRLQALRLLGHTTVPVHVLNLTELEAQLVEIDENLIRREFSVLERSEKIAKRKRVFEQLHPEAKVGGAPGKAGGGKRTKDPGSGSFVDDTAAKTGRGRSTIHEEVQIASMPTAVRDVLRATPTADKKGELLRIAKLPLAEQLHVAERIARGEPARVAIREGGVKAPADVGVPADEGGRDDAGTKAAPSLEDAACLLERAREVLERGAGAWAAQGADLGKIEAVVLALVPLITDLRDAGQIRGLDTVFEATVAEAPYADVEEAAAENWLES